MENESPWSTALMTSLRVAFGLLLLILTLISFSQIFLSILSKIAVVDRAAWIGFWGNIVGGVIGLVGAAAAAVAAIYVLREQMKRDKINKQVPLHEVLEALSSTVEGSITVSRSRFDAALVALRKDSLSGALSALKSIVLIYRRLDPSILGQVAVLSPSVAIRRVGLDDQAADLQLLLNEAGKIRKRAATAPASQEARGIALGATAMLAIRAANLHLSIVRYMRGLRAIAKSSELRLSRAESFVKLEQELKVRAYEFKAEGDRLHDLMMEARPTGDAAPSANRQE